jgi:hypothetical protein
MDSYYKLHRVVAKFLPAAFTSPLVPVVNAVLGGAFLASAGK